MTELMDMQIHSSFRDPAGFLFRRDDVLLRQVNESYASDYDACAESGLFDRLISSNLMISHTEVDDAGMRPGMYRVIKPDEIPYISYPYEWSMSQLRDAALLTLEIQRIALELGLSLKDASAYNVQFSRGRPIFIDTLSFEKYVEGTPWVAYRQFCQHFLAPLTLMAVSDLRLRQLQSRYIDGLPLDLVSRMLPNSTYFKCSTLAHIHLHARSQKKHEDSGRSNAVKTESKLSKQMLQALVASLRSAVEKLSGKDVPTEWGEYYQDTNYSDSAMVNKEKIVEAFVTKFVDPKVTLHDLGANTGHFSKVVARHCDLVIAHDVDEMAVERHYREIRQEKGTNILPLLLDLANPTPAIGWDLRERMSFHERATGGAAIALALIHHICISNNVPLRNFAEFLSRVFGTLIIEFVPKEDSQVQRLLATRRDIFEDYNNLGFERAFFEFFEIREQCPVDGSCRTMYVMTRRV